MACGLKVIVSIAVIYFIHLNKVKFLTLFLSLCVALRKAAKHPPKPMINLFWTRILIPKEEDQSPSKEKEIENKEETATNSSTSKNMNKVFFFSYHSLFAMQCNDI